MSSGINLPLNVTVGTTPIVNGTNNTLLRNESGIVGDTDYTVPKTDGTVGQVLQTNGAGVVSFQTISTGITVGTTAVTSGTDGRVFFQAGGVVQQSASLFWDNTNSRLGVGATPASTVRLDVRAQGALSTDIAFRVRNSADTRNFLTVNGAGDVFNNGAQGLSGNAFFGENTGRSATGLYNCFFGFEAGRDNSTGANNCFFGVEAGRVNTSGGNNSFFGVSSGRGNSSGSNNSFFGNGAGAINSTGAYNSFVGNEAGSSNTTASFNSSFGFQAGHYNTTGGENVFLGVESGRKTLSGAFVTVANNSVFLGGLARANANSETNQIVIGHSAIGLGSNTSVIGNLSTTLWKAWGSGLFQNVTAPSVSITDNFHFYSNDITAGNAAPHFRTENGSIIKLYQNTAVTTTQGVADALTNLGVLASSTIAPTVQSVASAATVTPTFTNDLVKITAQAVALTLAAPTGTAIDGKDLMIRIKDDGNAQTITWTAGTGGYRAIGVTLPTTTTAGKTTYVGLIYNSDDSRWDAIGVTTEV